MTANPFTTILIAAPDEAAGRTVATGLATAGWPAEVVEVRAPEDLDPGFDRRMRAARALVLAAAALTPADLRGGLAGELATRARQAGVPYHAIVGRYELDPFGHRILDLQAVIEADTPTALEAAARELGGLL